MSTDPSIETVDAAAEPAPITTRRKPLVDRIPVLEGEAEGDADDSGGSESIETNDDGDMNG